MVMQRELIPLMHLIKIYLKKILWGYIGEYVHSLMDGNYEKV